MVIRSSPESFNTLEALESRAEEELKLVEEESKRHSWAREESVLKADIKDYRATAGQAAGSQRKYRAQDNKLYVPRVKAAHQESQDESRL